MWINKILSQLSSNPIPNTSGQAKQYNGCQAMSVYPLRVLITFLQAWKVRKKKTTKMIQRIERMIIPTTRSTAENGRTSLYGIWGIPLV